jgi:hypothetical protein
MHNGADRYLPGLKGREFYGALDPPRREIF